MDVNLAYPVPTSLSPSRVETFTSCPLAFRFSAIEKLPEIPNIHTVRGSLVHRALELAFCAAGPERTPDLFYRSLDRALAEYEQHPELIELRLDDEAAERFRHECRTLVGRYLTMEDPEQVRAIGLELRLEASAGPLSLRGVIDRLELDDGGGLVVTDYKTGRAPMQHFEGRRLGGVHFYSFLCEKVFGVRPSAIRLMYLGSGETIEARPTERSVQFVTTRSSAVFAAVERACVTGDFRSRPGPLCPFCSFQQWCPSFGGDPAVAAVEAPLRRVVVAA
ncbi:MAG: PD-(D/E)XK nuclease family protein [Actinomycetota bacterium]|nr:PD-(D/E)XK nuclease family protein [Actinomycetota bacterium]